MISYNHLYRISLMVSVLTFLLTGCGGSGSGNSDDNTNESSLSQFGITWTFDKDYQTGQFANGDYWVVGPVTIVGIDPVSETITESPYWRDGTIERTVHGSMINPDPANGATQGYDSAMYREYGDPSYYDPSMNVAYGISSGSPLTVNVNESLVSSISQTPQPDHTILGIEYRADLKTAAVLTVLGSAPPEGSFRPPFSGTDKSIKFNKNQLDGNDYDLFGNLAPTTSVPEMSEVERMFERPWLDHTPDWIGATFTNPFDNMRNYGREISTEVGIGAIMLNLNLENQDKETLLINMAQVGIDLYGILVNNGENVWRGMGGFSSGRFFPILLAGIVFDDNDMKSIGTNTLPNNGIYHFGEIDQTFYTEETSPGVYNYGVGGYTAGDVGLPDWSKRHWWQIGLDNRSWTANYRRCCTANSWAGYILASHIMGIKDLWNHDALFDYMDRFMTIQADQGETGGLFRQQSRFLEEMWDTYRADYGCVWTRDDSNDIYSNGSNPCG